MRTEHERQCLSRTAWRGAPLKYSRRGLPPASANVLITASSWASVVSSCKPFPARGTRRQRAGARTRERERERESARERESERARASGEERERRGERDATPHSYLITKFGGSMPRCCVSNCERTPASVAPSRAILKRCRSSRNKLLIVTSPIFTTLLNTGLPVRARTQGDRSPPDRFLVPPPPRSACLFPEHHTPLTPPYPSTPRTQNRPGRWGEGTPGCSLCLSVCLSVSLVLARHEPPTAPPSVCRTEPRRRSAVDSPDTALYQNTGDLR
eukprot:COSAG03_NODE_1165_length_4676_cov_9.472580_7_plen_272_part_00